MSAWLRYNKIAADLKKKAKEQEFEKRAVGNLYGGFKNKKKSGFFVAYLKITKIETRKANDEVVKLRLG